MTEMEILAIAGCSIWFLESHHALIFSVGQVFKGKKSDFGQNVFFYFFRSKFQFLCSNSIKVMTKSKTSHSQGAGLCVTQVWGQTEHVPLTRVSVTEVEN